MTKVSWQSVKRPFDPQKKGHFVLVLGPAKMGKTTVAAHFYEHLDPSRIFWISAGELDGWRAVSKSVGLDPEGIDVDELQNLGAFWQLLDSLRDGWHQLVVLDSFDGAARWAERFICAADGPRRRDRSTGIPKLDQRGFGLKLNWAVATVRDHLYPITLSGTHVLVTCGLKSQEMASESVLVPDIEGQSALVVPRFFGDVALLRRDQRQRVLVFEGQEGLSVTGSRSGFAATMAISDFVRQMLDLQSENPKGSRSEPSLKAEPAPASAAHEPRPTKAERAPRITQAEEPRPWWQHRFPELGPDYRLQSGDFEADAAGAVGASLYEATAWLRRVTEAARILKEESRVSQLSRRDIALICWAHELQRSSTKSGGEREVDDPGGSAPDFERGFERGFEREVERDIARDLRGASAPASAQPPSNPGRGPIHGPKHGPMRASRRASEGDPERPRSVSARARGD